MSELAQLINGTNTVCRATSTSRKRVLQEVAELIADETVNADVLFDGLMARERLGSTGLGDGVAIPHCRMPCTNMKIALVTLADPVDYEAPDGAGVDILFVLIVPEDENTTHLDALAALASVFSHRQNRLALRACKEPAALVGLMQDLLQQVAHSKSA